MGKRNRKRRGQQENGYEIAICRLVSNENKMVLLRPLLFHNGVLVSETPPDTGMECVLRLPLLATTLANAVDEAETVLSEFQRTLEKKQKRRGPSPAPAPVNNHIYTLCVAAYYIEGEDPMESVRVTAVVTDLRTDRTVEIYEAWSEDTNIDKASDAILALSIKYKVSVTLLEAPVLLEKCPCGGCDGYLTRKITSHDLAQLRHSQTCPALN